MQNHRESQNVRILKWLRRRRKLTQERARELFDCWRLSGRIKDLRNLGWDIRKNMIKTQTGKKFAEYYLNITKNTA